MASVRFARLELAEAGGRLQVGRLEKAANPDFGNSFMAHSVGSSFYFMQIYSIKLESGPFGRKQGRSLAACCRESWFELELKSADLSAAIFKRQLARFERPQWIDCNLNVAARWRWEPDKAA